MIKKMATQVEDTILLTKQDLKPIEKKNSNLLEKK